MMAAVNIGFGWDGRQKFFHGGTFRPKVILVEFILQAIGWQLRY
jgi:hypothetical protein